ncbi:SMP-30/gluconolactonase/LRE family protein [Arcicella rosea]|uniref:Sugar lactone lactonase YvrE n=1 Tax=Arcicella rosea TaxID=502909 RepID=A0A841EFQ7_9BACT|nr:SMP-30/gluconolactonase/LRE family protein [Arcicella rosea]MBB6001836.1 sugar lactone lactonase YvrE [Arcicella rosea]
MKKTMTRYSLSLALFSLLSSQTFAQKQSKVEDFTAENLFTNNIEGPNFDKAGNLYVVNFKEDGTIGKVNPDGTCELFLTLPKGSTANAIQFDKAGNMYLADFSGHNVLKVDMKTKAVSTYCHNDAFNQPNDICITKKDVIFASDPSWKNSTGKIWRIDKGGKETLLTDQMGTTNGICLSPDEKTLYVNESIQRKVWAFDVDLAGNISKKRLFASFEDGGLDGMKCDAKGNLYVCRWGLGKILVFSKKGKLLKEVQLKGLQSSNLVFSPNGKYAYVTLQDRKGMERFKVK